MDLGKAKLLRTGLNTLHQAIHPVHGIAWTDGKQVCLTSLYFMNGVVKFGDTNVIGQFEHVLGLSWGPLCCPDTPALLAVQHKKHITVWQLQLSALEHNKLLCTQTCEMSEPFPLLSQGCVWHPKTDVLAVLTKRDLSVLFSVRVDNRRTRADFRCSGLIHSACWTKDGTRLVVAIGSSLHSYIWNDVQKSLLVCSFCPIFDVGGSICAIEATGEAQVAVATELPLDKICGLNAGMAFDVPEEASEEPGLMESRRRSVDDRSCLPSPGPVDLTHLLSRHRRSDPSPMVHLRRRDNATGSGQDSSHLILVTYERKVTTTRKVSIPGILVPDIVAFDPRGSTVAVASNTCNMVLVYCITASAMPNIQQISLHSSERPKGCCFLDDKTLLLMVGRQKSNDPAFLPSSNTDKYVLRLIAKQLMCDDGESPTSPPSPSAHYHESSSSPSSPSNFGNRIRRHSEQLSNVDEEQQQQQQHLGIKELMLPGGGVVGSPGNRRRKLVEEVRSGEVSPVPSSSVDFFSYPDRAASSASSVTVDNHDMDQHVNRRASLTVGGHAGARDCTSSSSRPGSPRFDLPADKLHFTHDTSTLPMAEKASTPAATASKERALDQLGQNMDKLFARFTDVQQCMTELRDHTQNGKKAQQSVVYPNACEPPYVNVTCQKQLSENVFIDERRPVLLCEGKLCLRALQDLFNLTLVEMIYGPLWIVLVADADGFVPLTFKPKEELTVRNGKRKTHLPETSCPSSPAPGQSPNPTTDSST